MVLADYSWKLPTLSLRNKWLYFKHWIQNRYCLYLSKFVKFWTWLDFLNTFSVPFFLVNNSLGFLKELWWKMTFIWRLYHWQFFKISFKIWTFQILKKKEPSLYSWYKYKFIEKFISFLITIVALKKKRKGIHSQEMAKTC